MSGLRSPAVDELRASLPEQLRNCATFWEGFGHLHGGTDGVPWFRSGVALGEVNGVRRASSVDLPKAVRQVRATLHDVPWTWWVADDHQAVIEQQLHDQGLETVERMPHMAIRTSIDIAAVSSGLRVRRIGDEELDEFVALWVTNFGVPEQFVEAIQMLERERPRRDEQCTYLAGYLDGRMVATTLLLVAHEVAGIYCVTTHADYRGRGCGRTMTLSAMAEARRQNLPVVSLQATPDGLPLYRSIGFEELTSYAILTTAAEHT